MKKMTVSQTTKPPARCSRARVPLFTPPRRYTAPVPAVLMSMVFSQPVFAADVGQRPREIMQDVYNQIVLYLYGSGQSLPPRLPC